MAKTVIGLFDSADEAHRVVTDLVAAGCRRDDINLVETEAGIAAALAGLVGLDLAEDEAAAYADGVRRGNVLVVAKTADVAVGPAAAAINRHHPLDSRAGRRWEGGVQQERVDVERMPADRPVGAAARAAPERAVEDPARRAEVERAPPEHRPERR